MKCVWFDQRVIYRGTPLINVGLGKLTTIILFRRHLSRLHSIHPRWSQSNAGLVSNKITEFAASDRSHETATGTSRFNCHIKITSFAVAVHTFYLLTLQLQFPRGNNIAPFAHTLSTRLTKLNGQTGWWLVAQPHTLEGKLNPSQSVSVLATNRTEVSIKICVQDCWNIHLQSHPLPLVDMGNALQFAIRRNCQ